MRANYRKYRRGPKRQQARRSGRMTFLQVAIPAALLGTFGGLVYTMGTSGGPMIRAETGDAAAFSCSNPITVDGDTLRCGATRIRLQGIDAPEMAGHCRPGRECAPGDPIASTDNLRQLVARSTMDCRQTDTDHYGRIVAVCAVEGVDLSCEQVRSGHAIRRYAPLTC